MLVSIRNVNANGFIYYGEFTEFGSSKEGSLANGKRKHKFRPSIALRNCLEDIEEIRNRGESRLNQKWRESMSELTKDETLLVDFLYISGMNTAEVIWIMDMLPTERAVARMITYIANENMALDPKRLHEAALKISHEEGAFESTQH